MEHIIATLPPGFSHRLGATVPFATSLAMALTFSALAAPAEGKGPPDRVVVTNPITVANPVTSVTVSNTTPVPVSVTNAPPVTVNIDATALAKAMGVQRPFARSFNCTSTGVFSAHCTGSYIVPATERYIIEYVSHHCTMSVGSKFSLSLQAGVSTSDPVSNYGISVTDQTGVYILSVGAILDGGQVTRIYAGAGTTVSVAGTAAAAPQSGTVDCNITVAGQAVDVP